MPQIGHRIDERALMPDARSGAGARRGDLVLAGHVRDQFRKPGGSDDHRRDVQCHGRLAVIPSEVCVAETSERAAGWSVRVRSGRSAKPAPLSDAPRAPGWPRSGQPWRAFQRGFRLLSTNTLRPRRTTTDPAFCFNALSEFLAFIVRRPFGPSSLLLQVVEAATIFLRSKFRPGKDPCDQSRHGATGTVRRAAAWRDADGTAQALRPLPLIRGQGASRVSGSHGRDCGGTTASAADRVCLRFSVLILNG
jgi:hypothetical protein